eukprot:CAMPEP_0170533544 /NCGR_PEP_ID=MMETSP0209-20121228/83197_1 /TAXON_ID=665100 ORGANISM="Litonotus pictus, Strain P1" /NCGR_SAMPLE_ID=MMETSP0209 /ASSEMBLY_ACC=CAM_ASM_000301 /LENGTH=32 /DNA_ID= /DNA_START= /DNA_END= /DNA_ORIENTATION=
MNMSKKERAKVWEMILEMIVQINSKGKKPVLP